MANSIVTVLLTGTTTNTGAAVKLKHYTAGTVAAGAGTRETKELWAVEVAIPGSGSVGGQKFADKFDALDRFNKITGVYVAG